MSTTIASTSERISGSRAHRWLLIGLITVLVAEFVVRFWLPDGFGRPLYGDEVLFQPTWRLLTDTSVSLADRIDGYAVLSTPLPMVLFGVAERVGGGLWAPRLVATLFGLAIVAIAMWRIPGTTARLQLLAGLLVMPHFLRSSTVAYTDLVALLFVVLGLLAYDRGRHGWAALWFALGIASRQFVVAFPAAILLWEFSAAIRSADFPIDRWRERAFAAGKFPPDTVEGLQRMLPYAFSGLTLLGWFAMFGGLTPSGADATIGNVPEVQQSLFALDPEAGLFFLSVMGLFFVVPELVISPDTSLLVRPWRRATWFALVGLLLLALVLPFNDGSVMWGFNELALSDSVEFVVFLLLAALAVMRFAEWSLASVIVGTHAVMLMKAYPWSKYALPVVAALWLLHALDATRSTDVDTTAAAPQSVEAVR